MQGIQGTLGVTEDLNQKGLCLKGKLFLFDN